MNIERFEDESFMNDEQFNMECNNCEKIFEVCWNAENKVLHTIYANS